VDVKLDIALRIFMIEEEKLGYECVGNLVIDRCSRKMIRSRKRRE